MAITTIGKHRVRAGSLMDDLSELVPEPVDIFYCDPPWGPGALKMFETMNQKTGEDTANVRYFTFLNRFFELIVSSTKLDSPIFVEYGNAWKSDIETMARKYGLFVNGLTYPVYGPGNPYLLFVMGKHRRSCLMGYLDSMKGMKGYATVRTALAPYAHPGMTIFDPCCGFGGTAKAALQYGLHFVGNELSAQRLKRAIALLQKAR